MNGSWVIVIHSAMYVPFPGGWCGSNEKRERSRSGQWHVWGFFIVLMPGLWSLNIQWFYNLEDDAISCITWTPQKIPGWKCVRYRMKSPSCSAEENPSEWELKTESLSCFSITQRIRRVLPESFRGPLPLNSLLKHHCHSFIRHLMIASSGVNATQITYKCQTPSRKAHNRLHTFTLFKWPQDYLNIIVMDMCKCLINSELLLDYVLLELARKRNPVPQKCICWFGKKNTPQVEGGIKNSVVFLFVGRGREMILQKKSNLIPLKWIVSICWKFAWKTFGNFTNSLKAEGKMGKNCPRWATSFVPFFCSFDKIGVFVHRKCWFEKEDFYWRISPVDIFNQLHLSLLHLSSLLFTSLTKSQWLLQLLSCNFLPPHHHIVEILWTSLGLQLFKCAGDVLHSYLLYSK